MRVNVYAEEMTERVEIISKDIDGHRFTGLRLYLELPATVGGKQYQGPFQHRPGDDDSSAVTFWGKRDLRTVLRKMLAELDTHYASYDAKPDAGGWIAYGGRGCPVPPQTSVLVRFRDGTESENTTPSIAARWDWSHVPNRPGDIIAYKPAALTSAQGLPVQREPTDGA